MGVAINRAGNIVFSGLSSSNDGDVSNNHGDYDAWIVKLKPVRSVDFSISIGDTAYDDFVDIVEIKGNYLAIGTTSTKTGDSAEPYYDAHAALVDKSGKIIFYKKYGGTASDAGNAVIAAPDGNAVFVGHVSSSDGDVVGNSGFNMWVWKIDVANNGDIIWQNHFGVSGEIAAAYGVVATHDGGFVLVGGVAPVIFDPYHVEDAYAAKVTNEGKALWTKRFGGSNAEFLNGGIEEENESILASGATGSNDGDVSGNHGGAEDAWLVDLGCSANEIAAIASNNKTGNFKLNNFPNPFSNTTTISFSLQKAQKVSVQIFDKNGTLVKILANEEMQAGTHQLIWNARDINGNAAEAGVYLLNMQAGSYVETTKLVIEN